MHFRGMVRLFHLEAGVDQPALAQGLFTRCWLFQGRWPLTAAGASTVWPVNVRFTRRAT